MIYNNLIYFLIVILALATNSVPDAAKLSLWPALSIFILKAVLFQRISAFLFGPLKIFRGAEYFKAEQRGSIAAIICFSIDVYFLDCQYYIAGLPLADRLPVLVSINGVFLFAFYLIIMWLAARKSYAVVFGRSYSPVSFVVNNLKLNIPIILPWVIISLFFDVLQLAGIPALDEILKSFWGEILLFSVFLLLVALFFPALVVRLWSCRPLPAGEYRERIEKFCRRQQLRYADILTWPLFEGQMLTAGVMGLTRRFRYLLVTPGLLRNISSEELEAVMAHEIGHVKYYHLQLYLLLFVGFALLMQFSSYPLMFLLLNSDLFYHLLDFTGKDVSETLLLFSALPILVLMILYFRFFFGFFMRNFERQADLYAFQAMADAAPLNRVFEKIAILSGNIRDAPNWHHFSISQRVAFLRQCQGNPALVRRHHRKVYLALVVAVVLFGGAFWSTYSIRQNLSQVEVNRKFVGLLYKQQIKALHQQVRTDPGNSLLYRQIGDLYYSIELFDPAIKAYEKSLMITAGDPETLNNLAWILLTAPDPTLHDPERALLLAERAASLDASSHILDTLAVANWRNGRVSEAVEAEKKALDADPKNRQYYLRQLELFSTLPPEAGK